MHRLELSVLAALAAVLINVGCGDGEGSSNAVSPPGDDAGAGGVGGACEPATCEELDADCGEVDDGCGQTIECGAPCGACSPTTGVVDSEPRTARRARSTGFSGTDDQYAELYEVVCEDVSDCELVCAERGGTEDMCAASDCLPNGADGSDCLPAPVWDNLEAIQFEDASVFEMTQIVLVNTHYQDVMIADEFKLEMPAAAEIAGITVEILRAGDDSVADQSVKIVKRGKVGNAERALPQTWLEEPTWVTYGSPDDLWGETWSAADVNADDFGVALSAAYTDTVGNTRAYVDQIRVTVSYSVACD